VYSLPRENVYRAVTCLFTIQLQDLLALGKGMVDFSSLMHQGDREKILITLLLAENRKQNEIALATASSGIAATLLEGGKTADSALKLPLNIAHSETQLCNMSKNSGQGQDLEALDRTLQDVRGNNRPMGGAVTVLAGDFRQTLPVIPRSTLYFTIANYIFFYIMP
jgi:hypothetical protein